MITELFEDLNATTVIELYVTCPDISKRCILPTDCIYVFHKILEINGDYVRKQR